MFAASFAPRRCSLVSLFAPIAFALSSSLAFADGTGWYNSSQLAKGRFEYSQKCAVCHGAQLQGTGAPPLKGKPFELQWNGRKLAELYEYVHNNMPLGLAEAEKGEGTGFGCHHQDGARADNAYRSEVNIHTMTSRRMENANQILGLAAQPCPTFYRQPNGHASWPSSALSAKLVS